MYAVAGDWRDSAVRECAPVGKIRARRNRPETKRLAQEAIKNVRQPFMFHYPAIFGGMTFAVGFAAKKNR
jgi:hypothetical protein